jgi:predicted metal-binding membrane protein
MAAGLETDAPGGGAGPASDRAFLGISLFLFVLCAADTIYNSLASMNDSMPMTGLEAAVSFMGTWIVMTLAPGASAGVAAMMLPSLVPELLNYRRFVRSPHVTRLGVSTLFAGAGYFLVWTVFGTVAYIVGLSWSAAVMYRMDLAGFMPAITGGVLLLAGCFQFTSWKRRELGCCRDTAVLAGSLSPNPKGAWSYGLRLGLHCSLCCWGFMAVLLVTGMMNLAGMFIVAAAITLERLAPRPLWSARIAGALLLIAGFIGIARGFGLG